MAGRYCGLRVFHPKFLKAVYRELAGVFPEGPGTTELKAIPSMARVCFVTDHVVPLSAGGPSQITNLVTACWPYNFAKESSPWPSRSK